MSRVGDDGVCGYVMGGLGNQLFILAAAWEQSNRLGCPLYLDVSHFSVEGTHRLGLHAIEHPGQVLTASESSWRAVRLNAERVLPVPKRPWGRTFFERDGDAYQSSIDRIRPGTTLFGYFQSHRYFEAIESDILSRMLVVDETSRETEVIGEMAQREVITLHLRRGDYLAVSPDRQFVATVAYAQRAIRQLRSQGISLPVRVFSDSVDLVKSELSGFEGEFEFVEDGVLGTWATLKAMALGKAMIMSNSSFSWWAAALMQHQRGRNVPVVAPRPWTQTGTSKSDLLKPEWIALDAR